MYAYYLYIYIYIYIYLYICICNAQGLHNPFFCQDLSAVCPDVRSAREINISYYIIILIILMILIMLIILIIPMNIIRIHEDILSVVDSLGGATR